MNAPGFNNREKGLEDEYIRKREHVDPAQYLNLFPSTVVMLMGYRQEKLAQAKAQKDQLAQQKTDNQRNSSGQGNRT